METSERLESQMDLVEYIGRIYEKEGYQPVAARILGLLMVMDKEEYTFDEIVEALSISKSSASVALRNLDIRGVIEYVTHPGDRKRYFRFVSLDLNKLIHEIGAKLKRDLSLMEQILALKGNPESRNAVLIKSISRGMAFFIDKIEEFRAEYMNKL